MSSEQPPQQAPPPAEAPVDRQVSFSGDVAAPPPRRATPPPAPGTRSTTPPPEKDSKPQRVRFVGMTQEELMEPKRQDHWDKEMLLGDTTHSMYVGQYYGDISEDRYAARHHSMTLKTHPDSALRRVGLIKQTGLASNLAEIEFDPLVQMWREPTTGRLREDITGDSVIDQEDHVPGGIIHVVGNLKVKSFETMSDEKKTEYEKATADLKHLAPVLRKRQVDKKDDDSRQRRGPAASTDPLETLKKRFGSKNKSETKVTEDTGYDVHPEVDVDDQDLQGIVDIADQQSKFLRKEDLLKYFKHYITRGIIHAALGFNASILRTSHVPVAKDEGKRVDLSDSMVGQPDEEEDELSRLLALGYQGITDVQGVKSNRVNTVDTLLIGVCSSEHEEKVNSGFTHHVFLKADRGHIWSQSNAGRCIGCGTIPTAESNYKVCTNRTMMGHVFSADEEGKRLERCSGCGVGFAEVIKFKECMMRHGIGHTSNGERCEHCHSSVEQLAKYDGCIKKGHSRINDHGECTTCGEFLVDKQRLPLACHDYGRDNKCQQCGMTRSQIKAIDNCATTSIRHDDSKLKNGVCTFCGVVRSQIARYLNCPKQVVRGQSGSVFPTDQEVIAFKQGMLQALATGYQRRNLVWTDHRRNPSNRKQSKIVVVLVGGDLTTAKQEVLVAVGQGWPVVVVEGSGGYADVLANTYAKVEELAPEAGIDQFRTFLSGSDPATAEILNNGKIKIIHKGSPIQNFEHEVGNSLKGDEILAKAWYHYAVWRFNKSEWQFTYELYQIALLMLGIAATFVAALQTFLFLLWQSQGKPYPKEWQNAGNVREDTENIYLFFTLLQWLIIFLPISLTLLHALNNRVNPWSKFCSLRIASNTILREVFMYRTRTLAYSYEEVKKQKNNKKKKAQGAMILDDAKKDKANEEEEDGSPITADTTEADAELAALSAEPQMSYESREELLGQQLMRIQEELVQSEVSSVTLADPILQGRESIPPNDIVESGDNGMKDLSPDEYLRFRVVVQRQKYDIDAIEAERMLSLMQNAIYVFGALGTAFAALAAYGLGYLQAWVALTTAIVNSTNRFLDYSRLQTLHESYNQSLHGLSEVETWWSSLGTNADDMVNRNQLVRSTEKILQEELENWAKQLQKGSEAAAHAEEDMKKAQEELNSIKQGKDLEQVRKMKELGLDALSPSSVEEALADPNGSAAKKLKSQLVSLNDKMGAWGVNTEPIAQAINTGVQMGNDAMTMAQNAQAMAQNAQASAEQMYQEGLQSATDLANQTMDAAKKSGQALQGQAMAASSQGQASAAAMQSTALSFAATTVTTARTTVQQVTHHAERSFMPVIQRLQFPKEAVSLLSDSNLRTYIVEKFADKDKAFNCTNVNLVDVALSVEKNVTGEVGLLVAQLTSRQFLEVLKRVCLVEITDLILGHYKDVINFQIKDNECEDFFSEVKKLAARPEAGQLNENTLIQLVKDEHIKSKMLLSDKKQVQYIITQNAFKLMSEGGDKDKDMMRGWILYQAVNSIAAQIADNDVDKLLGDPSQRVALWEGLQAFKTIPVSMDCLSKEELMQHFSPKIYDLMSCASHFQITKYIERLSFGTFASRTLSAVKPQVEEYNPAKQDLDLVYRNLKDPEFRERFVTASASLDQIEINRMGKGDLIRAMNCHAIMNTKTAQTISSDFSEPDLVNLTSELQAAFSNSYSGCIVDQLCDSVTLLDLRGLLDAEGRDRFCERVALLFGQNLETISKRQLLNFLSFDLLKDFLESLEEKQLRQTVTMLRDLMDNPFYNRVWEYVKETMKGQSPIMEEIITAVSHADAMRLIHIISYYSRREMTELKKLRSCTIKEVVSRIGDMQLVQSLSGLTKNSKIAMEYYLDFMDLIEEVFKQTRHRVIYEMWDHVGISQICGNDFAYRLFQHMDILVRFPCTEILDNATAPEQYFPALGLEFNYNQPVGDRQSQHYMTQALYIEVLVSTPYQLFVALCQVINTFDVRDFFPEYPMRSRLLGLLSYIIDDLEYQGAIKGVEDIVDVQDPFEIARQIHIEVQNARGVKKEVLAITGEYQYEFYNDTAAQLRMMTEQQIVDVLKMCVALRNYAMSGKLFKVHEEVIDELCHVEADEWFKAMSQSERDRIPTDMQSANAVRYHHSPPNPADRNKTSEQMWEELDSRKKKLILLKGYLKNQRLVLYECARKLVFVARANPKETEVALKEFNYSVFKAQGQKDIHVSLSKLVDDVDVVRAMSAEEGSDGMNPWESRRLPENYMVELFMIVERAKLVNNHRTEAMQRIKTDAMAKNATLIGDTQAMDGDPEYDDVILPSSETPTS